MGRLRRLNVDISRILAGIRLIGGRSGRRGVSSRRILAFTSRIPAGIRLAEIGVWLGRLVGGVYGSDDARTRLGRHGNLMADRAAVHCSGLEVNMAIALTIGVHVDHSLTWGQKVSADEDERFTTGNNKVMAAGVTIEIESEADGALGGERLPISAEDTTNFS